MLDAGSDLFLRGAYRNLLGREPEPAGMEHWSGLLAAGTSPDTVAMAIIASPESTLRFVDEQYRTLLGRSPEPFGQGVFTSALAAGLSHETVQSLIMSSPEYFERANGTGSGFLAALYRDVLDRGIDDHGLSVFSAALDHGMSRAEVAGHVLASPEASALQVDRLYWQLLERQPDAPGRQAWMSALHGGLPMVQVVAGFIASPEFLGAQASSLPSDVGQASSLSTELELTSQDPFRCRTGWEACPTEAGQSSNIPPIVVQGSSLPSPPGPPSDGNRDGIPDVQQPNVVTLQAVTGHYVTIDGCGHALANVQTLDIPAGTTYQAFSWGWHSFEIAVDRPGDSAQVTLTLPQGARPRSYWKTDPGTGQPALFDFDGTTGAVITASAVSLLLVDGGRGDADQSANGVIVDPGGPSSCADSLCPPDIPFEDSGAEVPESIAGVYDRVVDLGVTHSPAGVRYGNGGLRFESTDLDSSGFGKAWGHTRTWTNVFDALNNQGNDVIVKQLPYLMSGSTTVSVVTSSTNTRYFDKVLGNYNSRHYVQDKLVENTGSLEFAFTDTAGNVTRFHNFSASHPIYKRGSFKSFTDAKGNVTSVTSYTSDGKAAELQRSLTEGSNTYTESYLYSYYTSGSNLGQLSNATLRRQTNGGAWSTVRQADYVYYNGTESNGTLNDVKKVTIKDGAGTTLDVKYYRYYTSDTSPGYTGGLKYVFNPESYARLAAAFANPETASDAQVAPYADAYYEYNASQAVTKAVLQGAGSSYSDAGLGTYTYSYTGGSGSGYNGWRMKTTETLPDGNQNIVYTNSYLQPMLHIYKEASSGNQWRTFYKYDSKGRQILKALPSAVSGHDDTKTDLLNSVMGNYQYLRDSSGLVEVQNFASSTTATDTAAGNVNGYYQNDKIKKGETGTEVSQAQQRYFSRSAGTVTIYPTADNIVYRNTDGTGAQTTSYSYTWFTSTVSMESVATSLPVVSAGQNGPGSADVSTTYFDVVRRAIWSKDGDGFIIYTAYDPQTSAVSKTIEDVDTTRTSDFSNLPSGWSTPSGGGLHIVSQMETDSLGRTTKFTDALGNIDYTVFLDTNHEVRSYPGWNTSTNTPTGPTQVSREDRGSTTGYSESLTMSAAPAVSGGRPTGTEAVSSLETLSRSYVTAGGQNTRSDGYFSLAGLTYSTALYIGTENTHYYKSESGFDKHGRSDRSKTPAGTISRSYFDGLGRLVSSWVGLDDTPTSGDWSPTNTAGTDLVKTSENVYDAGGVGDSNLTRTTQFPGGSAANRVNESYFDWRNRQVASKQGVEASESTSLNRAIFYTEFNNLSQAIAGEQYDGDGVTITDGNSDGVPDKPSAGLLRARSTTDFDDQGRVYAGHVFSVDQSTGAVSSNSLNTNTWYDHRGQTIKTSSPGGAVSKTAYDGKGRTTKSFMTDGGGDTGWSDADDVTGDNVLSQSETQYDACCRAILQTVREHFHDDTNTGALGDPSTNPKARVSYVAMYYDLADRLTDTVNVGTNGGTAYTRPASVPARSDTVLVTSQAYNSAGWVETVTDPRGILSKTFYDASGRTTKTIEAYTDGVQSDADDKTTEFTYDGSGNMLTLKALLTGGGYQKTEWVYGVSTAAGSDFNSNDIVSAMKYPDKSTGDPSNSEKETYTVNALGERKTLADRNGSVHTYSFDVVGRGTADAITTLGTGVDGAVRRLETAYDTAGRANLFTSYNAASAGSIVNQVQQEYNGLGQQTKEWQAHSGAVNTGTSPKVQYAYSEMSGGANHSRPTSMTYPNGRVLTFTYASGLDSTISRLSSIDDSGVTLEALSYLGQGSTIKRAHPQPGVDLTYIKQGAESNGDAGDQYTGLDRFGRVVDQRWLKTSDGSHTDRFKYGHDRNSSRLYRDNLLNDSFDELYHTNGASAGYDQLNQLTDFRRGALSDTNSDNIPDTVTSPTRQQGWDFDALGNFDSQTTDGTPQSRTHNKQNQSTVVGGNNLTFDSNGNTTKDETGKTYTFDAFNHLVLAKDSGGSTIASYSFDALGRRIIETVGGTTRDIFFSPQWQVVEEQIAGTAKTQYVWSPVYIDALIARDRDADGNGSLEERLFAQQDANFNVTSVINSSGAVVERYIYDPYGTPTFLTGSWTTLSGSAYAWTTLHQGGRFEVVTGLYLFRHRDYSPTLGRWIQKDPIGRRLVDLNHYWYNDNVTTTLQDPEGLAPVLKYTTVFDATGGLCGAFLWAIKWNVQDPVDAVEGGFIIQEIKMRSWVPVGSGFWMLRKHYFEAWRVTRGTTQVSDEVRVSLGDALAWQLVHGIEGAGRMAGTLFSDHFYSPIIGMRSAGGIKIEAKARLYDGLEEHELPIRQAWSRNNVDVPEAGTLLSVNATFLLQRIWLDLPKKSSGESAPQDRSLEASWSCSPLRRSPMTTVTRAPTKDP